MDYVIQFMQSVTGRTLRVFLGIILLALGIVVMYGASVWGGIVIALIGLVALAVGLLGVCLIGPLFGYTLTGQKHPSPVGS